MGSGLQRPKDNLLEKKKNLKPGSETWGNIYELLLAKTQSSSRGLRNALMPLISQTFVSLFARDFMYNMYSKCCLYFKELTGNPGEITLELRACAKAADDSGAQPE